MTKDSTTTPAEAGKDWFTTYTVFARPQGEPGWLGLEGRDAKRAAKEFDEAVARVARTGVTVRGVYDVSGMREAGDVMVWMYGQVPEDLQAAIRELRRTRLLEGTTMVLSAMGADRMAEFNKDHVPAFAMGRKALKWLCFYPFVRSYEWYLLPEEERSRMLAEHGRKGAAFTSVLANTVAAFGISDYEWLLALEDDELMNLVDMMRDLRYTDARLHVRHEVPFYPGRRITTTELIEVLQ